jgi:hypothetical protein
MDHPTIRQTPAHYHGSIDDFIETHPNQILGCIVEAARGEFESAQTSSWEVQIEVLLRSLRGLRGHVYFEFGVPRVGRRIDVVVVSGAVVFPIEFKVGSKKYLRSDVNQIWDYALDLKNFHQASHTASIMPILVATDADSEDLTWDEPHADGVRPPLRTNSAGLDRAIRHGLSLGSGHTLDGVAWGVAPYQPTPTIIEAARALYARHTVTAISRNDAGTENLAITARVFNDVIDRARSEKMKAILFVTGVPGSGKTRVGLDIATRRREQNAMHAVFLSGNQPLVSVLKEALVRDELTRARRDDPSLRKGLLRSRVDAFIQNIHHFRDLGVDNQNDAPTDHVVIFDEAQRAWDQERTSRFMRDKKGQPNFMYSEPEFLISYMDRHQDWAVVICLVGGGQEINTGESGISAWLDAARSRFPNWHLYLSPEMSLVETSAEGSPPVPSLRVTQEHGLHLASSIRSFRSDKVSGFVQAVLDRDQRTASHALRAILGPYHVAITRDLEKAKAWIRKQARGTERVGLVASSKAQRLRPHAIDIRYKVDPVQWFLNDPEDTRSSSFLEDAATEFQVQGLELDWACVTWDADLRFGDDGWQFHFFAGRKWNKLRKPIRQRYLLNAYRVLLTRARQGMVVFVPPGDRLDPTRKAAFYDPTFDYLRSIGMPECS